ncbi:MAG: hypothetical protein AAF637_14605 [Pseudomonadota bacterium]
MLLVGYTLIALMGPWLAGQMAPRASDELFPFFNWSLFSSPRSKSGRYAVRITAVQPPTDIEAALLGRTLDDIDSFGVQANIRFHKTARSLARAQRRGDATRVAAMRTMLSNFLRPYGITEFELLRYTYEPLAYYKAGEIVSETVVGRYRLDTPP